MEKVRLTCINCPLGCSLEVTLDQSKVIFVTGNTCPRGEAYGRKEVTSPTRIVTSTIPVKKGHVRRVSVKTRSDIPKDKIFDCVREIKRMTAEAPVHIGEVLLTNVANTGVDIIATSNAE